MGIPIPEFKVLLYGPGLPASGQRAHARFEGSVLTVVARGNTQMTAAQNLSLKLGGYDGRQWLIAWTAPEGDWSAMLQSEDALEAFIELAPPEITQRLIQSRKRQSHSKHRFILGLVLLLLLSLLSLFYFGLTGPI